MALVSAITNAVITTTTRNTKTLSPSLTTKTLTLLFIKTTHTQRAKTHTIHHHHHSRRLITTMSSSTDQKITAPYGSWASPITSDVVSGAAKGLGGTAVNDKGQLFWLESRPTESGYLLLILLAYYIGAS